MTLAPSASATFVRRGPAAPWGTLRRWTFGVSPDEALFARRGFAPGAPATQERLELIGRTFLGGYRTALEADRPETLGERLAAVPLELSGFAHEGAAMALALLDLVTPWRRDRLARFLAGPGATHVYMVHVGAGWALARLGRDPDRSGLPLDPLYRMLAIDGCGFHEGYFAWRRTLEAGRRPARLGADAARVFDQGLGRSLWFVACGDVERVVRRIGALPEMRHADLWSGIGLAAAYAGGVSAETLYELRAACGAHRIHVAQGVAFAAKARERAGNPAPHTALACEILAGRTVAEAARVTDLALAERAARPGEPPYEAWRRGIRERLASPGADA